MSSFRKAFLSLSSAAPLRGLAGQGQRGRSTVSPPASRPRCSTPSLPAQTPCHTSHGPRDGCGRGALAQTRTPHQRVELSKGFLSLQMSPAPAGSEEEHLWRGLGMCLLPAVPSRGQVSAPGTVPLAAARSSCC